MGSEMCIRDRLLGDVLHSTRETRGCSHTAIDQVMPRPSGHYEALMMDILELLDDSEIGCIHRQADIPTKVGVDH